MTIEEDLERYRLLLEELERRESRQKSSPSERGYDEEDDDDPRLTVLLQGYSGNDRSHAQTYK
jgi:hypothetical protein